MRARTADDLFRRFRRSGDPASLAALFDLTAPELFRVAQYLSAQEPEDLVQATFLTAIERRDSWDDSRSVVPWLVGILVNHGRVARRRKRQKPDPHLIQPRDVAGPEQVARERELAAELENAIAQLPETYRSVVRLTIEHGLSPAEIAASLGRERATVRSQLHRGLALLRKALPVGIGAGVAITASPGRGLAAVRAAVVEHASHVASTAGAVGGGAAAKWALVVVLALAVGWIVRTSSRSEDPAVLQEPAHAASDALSSRQDAAARTLATSEGSRTEADPSSHPVAKAGNGTLVVRVLRQANEEPLGGVPVLLRRSAALAHERLVPLAWRITQGDGGARFEGLAPGGYEVSTVSGTAGMTASVYAGRTSELELSLRVGIRVEGTVVDASGTPVPHADIYVDTGLTTPWATIAQADAQGRFFVPAISPGLRIGARHAGFAPSPHHTVSGRENSLVRVRIELLRRAARLRGTVVTETGKPVAGALIAVIDERKRRRWRDDRGLVWSDPQPLLLLADERGAFDSSQVPAGRTTVIASKPGLVGYTAAQVELELREGEVHFTHLRLPPSAVVHGHVRTSAGAAAGGRTVSLLRTGKRSGQGEARYDVHAFVPSSARTDAEGRYVIDGVVPGRYRVWTEGTSSATDPQVEVFAGSTQEVDLEIVGKDRLTLRIVGGSRELWGWLVSVQLWKDGRPRGGWHDAVSDRRGRVELEDMPLGDYKVMLYPKGTADTSHALPALVVADVRPSKEGRTIHVPPERLPTASVHATVFDELRRIVSDAELRLGLSSPYPAEASFGVDPRTGRVEAREVPPARYSIRIVAHGFPTLDLGHRTLEPNQRLDLGEVRLRKRD